MTPVHFTALSMVDISYFVDAKHHCQHAASKQMDAQWGEVFSLLRERKGRKVQVKHGVRWTAALPKLKITYMHHGRMDMYVWGL